MPNKRVRRLPAEKRSGRNRGRRALTVAGAAATATTMAFAPIAPTPTAEAATNRGLAYDLLYDFPGTLNPFSFVNSIVQTATQLNLLAQLPVCVQCEEIMGPIHFRAHPQGGVVMVPEYNALLYLWRGPEIVTTLLDFYLGIDFADIPVVGGIPSALTAIANAYEPAVDILINIGYNDVDPTTWKRAFDQFGAGSQFILGHPLGPLEYLAAFQAASTSAFDGTVALLQPIITDLINLFGIFGAGATPLSAAVAPTNPSASSAAVQHETAATPPAEVSPAQPSTPSAQRDVAVTTTEATHRGQTEQAGPSTDGVTRESDDALAERAAAVRTAVDETTADNTVADQITADETEADDRITARMHGTDETDDQPGNRRERKTGAAGAATGDHAPTNVSAGTDTGKDNGTDSADAGDTGASSSPGAATA